MDHLESEFAVENILFLTEMIEFRDLLRDKYASFLEDDEVMKIFKAKNINLPKDTPKSPIIYPSNDNHNKLNVMIRMDSVAFGEFKKVSSAPTTPSGDDMNTLDERERIFMLLYRKYIDKYNAALEINISYTLHTTLKHYYMIIANKMEPLTSEIDSIEVIEFVTIWNSLVLATREILSILQHSAQRCPYKI